MGANETRLRTANGPTAVTLASFGAAAAGGGVQVSWEAASEVDVLGYNVWRSQSAGSGYVRLNPQVIPAQGGQGSSLQLPGYLRPPGRTYYYRLEMVAWTAAPVGRPGVGDHAARRAVPAVGAAVDIIRRGEGTSPYTHQAN